MLIQKLKMKVLNAENEASDKTYAAPEENKGGEEA